MLVAQTLCLIVGLAIGGFFWWRARISSRPQELQDIAGCLQHRRRKSRKPVARAPRPYIPFHQGEIPAEVADQIKALEESQIVHAVSELNFELLKRHSNYPEHIWASVYNGTWGNGAWTAQKPCLLVFEFVFKGRKYELQRFMGDRHEVGRVLMPETPSLDRNEVATYGFEQIEVRVDARPMLVARSYTDSVAIIESHADRAAIQDLLSLYIFTTHAQAVSTAKARRDARRRERSHRASEKAALLAAFAPRVSG